MGHKLRIVRLPRTKFETNWNKKPILTSSSVRNVARGNTPSARKRVSSRFPLAHLDKTWRRLLYTPILLEFLVHQIAKQIATKMAGLARVPFATAARGKPRARVLPIYSHALIDFIFDKTWLRHFHTPFLLCIFITLPTKYPVHIGFIAFLSSLV